MSERRKYRWMRGKGKGQSRKEVDGCVNTRVEKTIGAVTNVELHQMYLPRTYLNFQIYNYLIVLLSHRSRKTILFYSYSYMVSILRRDESFPL